MTRLRRFADSLTFQVLAIAIVSRAGLAFANWFSLRILPRLGYYDSQTPDSLLPDSPLFDGWARWDSIHYLLISVDGYGEAGEGELGRGVPFFPLYPLLTRGFANVIGVQDTLAGHAIAGILVANLCFLAAVPLFAKLVARLSSVEIARTATTLLVISPLSFFFSAAYTESLFLLLSILAFLFAYDKKWLGSALGIMLASATRLFGLALIPAILLIAWRTGASRRELVATALVSPLGTVAYFTWTWWTYDDVLAYFHGQANWGGWDVRVGHYIRVLLFHPRDMIANPQNMMILINVMLAVLWLVALYWVWRHLEPGIALYTTIIVVFHVAYTWNSLGRYLLPALGVYIVGAMLLHRPGWNTWVRDAVYLGSTILLTLLTILFSHGFWIV